MSNCDEKRNGCTGDCSTCQEHCSSCDGDCSNCSSGCGHHEQKDLRLNLNEFSKIKKIIGVVSGKGGVGKSMVSSLIAVSLAQKGLKVGIMDADITGPSIGKTFGV